MSQKYILNEKNLVLGTANYNQIYGINKSNLSKQDFFNICKEYQTGSRIHLDLALRYNNIEKIFYGLDCFKFNVNLKIPSNIEKPYLFELIKLLKDKNFIFLDSVMFHDEKFLFDKQTYEIIDFLKSNDIKFGISFYNIEYLEGYISKIPLDLIQLPVNIFDQRILNKEIISIIEENKISIHARSIFLQGLLLNLEKYSNKLYFKNWSNNFSELNKFCQTNNYNLIEFFLSYVLQIKSIDKLVLGFDNHQQFKDLFKKEFIKIDTNFSLFRVDDKNLINPYMWKN